MTTIHRTSERANLSVRETEPRVTPQPPSRRFAETLGEGAHALLAGVEQAAGLLPGGAAVAAAVRGGAGAAGGGAAASTTGAGGPAQSSNGSLAEMMGSGANSAEELLRLQHEMAMHQQRVQTVSNVMKAEHDTNKAVIQNFR